MITIIVVYVFAYSMVVGWFLIDIYTNKNKTIVQLMHQNDELKYALQNTENSRFDYIIDELRKNEIAISTYMKYIDTQQKLLNEYIESLERMQVWFSIHLRNYTVSQKNQTSYGFKNKIHKNS